MHPIQGFLATPSIEEPIPLAPSLQPPPFMTDNRDDHAAVDATSPPLSHLRAARPLHRGRVASVSSCAGRARSINTH